VVPTLIQVHPMRTSSLATCRAPIDGYKALEMVVAMEQSVQTGGWVELPLR